MSQPLRIAVIADTHNRLPPQLPALIRDADEIWHLGDVCDPATLVEIELLEKPLIIVRGNNDTEPRWPLALNLTRNKIRFHLTHLPPSKAPVDTDIVLHAHTHVPRDETLANIRYLNPGALTHPRQSTPPSFAWLTLEPDGNLSWKIIPLK